MQQAFSLPGGFMAAAFHRGGHGLISLVDRLFATFQVARQRRLLASLDDRMLSDIGISRGDAYRETARAFWDVADARR